MPGPPGCAQRRAQLRAAGSEQGHGLGHIPPGSCGAHAEPGGQRGEGLAVAQVDQDQQGLLPGVQLAPGRADLPAVTADHAGQVSQGRTRQRQRSTVEKHRGPWQTKDCGDRFIYQGLRCPRSRHAARLGPYARLTQDQDGKGSLGPEKVLLASNRAR
jgi:hypothetical protein